MSFVCGVGFGDIGLFGLLYTGIGLLILLFVMIPVMIGDLRQGKTSFFELFFGKDDTRNTIRNKEERNSWAKYWQGKHQRYHQVK